MTKNDKPIKNFQDMGKVLKKPEFMKEDADFVSIAEQKMRSLWQGNKTFGNLTTSKIRNILTLVNQIYNDVIINRDEILSDKTVEQIKYLKVRLAYEAGRDNDKNKMVKKFIEESELIKGVDSIGTSKKNFIRYARYLEALVAYHRYLGGRDN